VAEKRVVCINKSPTHDDTHHHITEVGIGTDQGYTERLSVTTVISNLKSSWGDRYYVLGIDGSKSWVVVKNCPRCAHAHEVISTTPDNSKKDNLLSLSECVV